MIRRILLKEKDRDRFFKNFKKSKGCWVWNGYIDNKGYGRFCVKDQMYIASRVSWFIYNKKFKKNKMWVCHHCDNRKCVNPSHLFLGNFQTNVNDMLKKGRGFNQSKNICKYGHPLIGENVYMRSRGSRECKRCIHIRNSNRSKI